MSMNDISEIYKDKEGVYGWYIRISIELILLRPNKFYETQMINKPYNRIINHYE